MIPTQPALQKIRERDMHGRNQHWTQDQLDRRELLARLDKAIAALEVRAQTCLYCDPVDGAPNADCSCAPHWQLIQELRK